MRRSPTVQPIFFVDSLRGHRDREPDRVLQLDARNEALVRWLQCLTPRQYEIIVRRFGLDGHDEETLDKIGEDVGVTRERVRQIQIKRSAPTSRDYSG